MILEQISTILGILIMIIVILLASYWFTKRLASLTGVRRQSRYMKILDQLPLGQNKSIAITKIGNSYQLLAITEDKIQILSKLNEEDLVELNTEPKQILNSEFGDLLKHFSKRKEER